uniref:Putative secreted peptide n=1 Tax=Anopheles braziliensis TaxID=58242 RepID=A0A2M3ZVB3_9DIPT
MSSCLSLLLRTLLIWLRFSRFTMSMNRFAVVELAVGQLFSHEIPLRLKSPKIITIRSLLLNRFNRII